MNQFLNKFTNRIILIIGISIGLCTLIFDVYISYEFLHGLTQSIKKKDATLLDIAQFQQYLSELKDAETGQRGYLITGNVSYLEPYNHGLDYINSSGTQAFLDSSEKQEDISDNVRQLRKSTHEKIEELQNVINTYKTGGFLAAQKEVSANLGKSIMDNIRANTENILVVKQQILERTEQDMYSHLNFIIMLVVSVNILYGFLISICLYILYLETKKKYT
jgi:CHASE3 domain sensor protein